MARRGTITEPDEEGDINEVQYDPNGCFIGNLPHDVTLKQVKATFAEYGKVKKVIFPTIFDKKMKRRRHRGFCYVVFASADSTTKVLSAHERGDVILTDFPNHQIGVLPMKRDSRRMSKVKLPASRKGSITQMSSLKESGGSNSSMGRNLLGERNVWNIKSSGGSTGSAGPAPRFKSPSKPLSKRSISPRSGRSLSELARTSGGKSESRDTLFIGHLPHEATKEQVEKSFAMYGPVERVDWPTVMDESLGRRRHKGFCFVTFREAAHCNMVIERHQNNIPNQWADGAPGIYIVKCDPTHRVDVTRMKKGHKPGQTVHTLPTSPLNRSGVSSRKGGRQTESIIMNSNCSMFVGGLPHEADKVHIEKCFELHGGSSFKQVVLPTMFDKQLNKKRHRGFCYVEMKDEMVCNKIIEMALKNEIYLEQWPDAFLDCKKHESNKARGMSMSLRSSQDGSNRGTYTNSGPREKEFSRAMFGSRGGSKPGSSAASPTMSRRQTRDGHGGPPPGMDKQTRPTLTGAGNNRVPIESGRVLKAFQFTGTLPTDSGMLWAMRKVTKCIDGAQYIIKGMILTQDRNEMVTKSKFEEAAILGSLRDCSNVVRYYDAWLEKYIPQIGDEFVQHMKLPAGTKPTPLIMMFIQLEPWDHNLRDWLNTHAKRNKNEVWLIFRQCIQALHYIHGHNMAHRNMMPENIFMSMSKRGNIVAKVGNPIYKKGFKTPEEIKAKSSSVYAAPEMKEGAVSLGSKLDMYAMGIILFELFASFPGNKDRLTKISALKQMGHKASTIDHLANATDVTKLVFRLIQGVPEKRPAAREVMESDLVPTAKPAHLSLSTEVYLKKTAN